MMPAKYNQPIAEVFLHDILEFTDWPRLRKQKEALVAMLHECNVPWLDEIYGLVAFLDAIQDGVVDAGLVDEETVFGFKRGGES